MARLGRLGTVSPSASLLLRVQPQITPLLSTDATRWSSLIRQLTDRTRALSDTYTARTRAWDAISTAGYVNRYTGAELYSDRWENAAIEYRANGDPCPQLGPFAFVWADLWDQAQGLLRELASNPPAQGASGTDVGQWAFLIEWNVRIMRGASNIRGSFWFPTLRLPTDDPSNPWLQSDTGLVRTLMTGGSSPVYADGAPKSRAGYTYGARLEPQAVVDRSAAVTPAGAVQTPAGPAAGTWTPMRYLPVGQQIDFDPPAGRYGRGRVYGEWQPWLPGLRTQSGRQGADALNEIVAAHWAGAPLARGGDWFELNEGSVTKRAVLDVAKWIEEWRAYASAWATLSLTTVVFEAVGFYLTNVATYWRNKGLFNMDPAQAIATREALTAARFRAGTAPFQAVAGMLATAATTAGGAGAAGGGIAGALGELGHFLFGQFVLGQFAPSGPQPLFLRIPPLSCVGRTLEQQAQSAASGMQTRTPPPVPGWTPPPVTSQPAGVSPLVVGGVLLGVAAIVGVGVVLGRR